MRGLLCRCLSRLYRASLRLYPSEFRRRFGREMSQTFDDRCRAVARSQSIAGLIRFAGRIAADHFVTAFTERFVASSEVPQPASDGVPTFLSFGDDTPRPFALTQGVLLAMVTFAVVSFLIGKGGVRSARLIGSHHPSPSHLLPVPTAAPPAELDAEVKLSPSPEMVVSGYFRKFRVLRALDSDRDGVLSAAEIANASRALRTRDLNGDGILSVEECGLLIPNPSTDARRLFMRLHPILEVLDANRDGEISAQEIARAPAALRTLDKSGDGMLTEVEVLPDAVRTRPILEAFRKALQSN